MGQNCTKESSGALEQTMKLLGSSKATLLVIAGLLLALFVLMVCFCLPFR